MGWFDSPQNSSGEVMSRLTSDTAALRGKQLLLLELLLFCLLLLARRRMHAHLPLLSPAGGLKPAVICREC
jgi:hypothetical protein